MKWLPLFSGKKKRRKISSDYLLNVPRECLLIIDTGNNTVKFALDDESDTKEQSNLEKSNFKESSFVTKISLASK